MPQMLSKMWNLDYQNWFWPWEASKSFKKRFVCVLTLAPRATYIWQLWLTHQIPFIFSWAEFPLLEQNSHRSWEQNFWTCAAWWSCSKLKKKNIDPIRNEVHFIWFVFLGQLSYHYQVYFYWNWTKQNPLSIPVVNTHPLSYSFFLLHQISTTK